MKNNHRGHRNLTAEIAEITEKRKPQINTDKHRKNNLGVRHLNNYERLRG